MNHVESCSLSAKKGGVVITPSMWMTHSIKAVLSFLSSVSGFITDT